jgi:hypothetical protein
VSRKFELVGMMLVVGLSVALNSCSGNSDHGTPSAPPMSSTTKYTESVLYSFTGGGDGPGGASDLISDSKGNLYGTSGLGGDMTGCAEGCGFVFELSPPASGSGSWTEAVLYSFTGGTDGYSPSGGLTFDAKGSLYGMASPFFSLLHRLAVRVPGPRQFSTIFLQLGQGWSLMPKETFMAPHNCAGALAAAFSDLAGWCLSSVHRPAVPVSGRRQGSTASLEALMEDFPRED